MKYPGVITAGTGSGQGQVGWSSEQPGLVEDVPAHGREVGTRWSLRSPPTQAILRFYDSMIRTAKKGSNGAIESLIYVLCLEEFLIPLEQATRMTTTDPGGSHQP